MAMLGTFHIIQGLVASSRRLLPRRQVGPRHQRRLPSLGLGQLIGGIIVLIAGFAVFAGRTWARVVGVIVAMLSAIVNVGFLAAYPLWSLMIASMCRHPGAHRARVGDQVRSIALTRRPSTQPELISDDSGLR
jgi:hypothetical protein